MRVEIRQGDPTDPLTGLVRIAAEVPHDLILGRGFAMRHAVDTAAPHEALGCPVATPAALVLLKLEAGGTQDRADVLALADAGRAIDGAPWLAELVPLVGRCSAYARAAGQERRGLVLRAP